MSRYLSSTPCKQGHIERYVASNKCVACSYLIHKKWVEANRERFNKLHSDWVKAHPIKRKEYHRRWHKSPGGKLSHARRKHKLWYEGPTNPQGEAQWLKKAKALHRGLKRMLRNQELPQLQSEG